MDPSAKGTVTPLASLFSEEEAKKAASFVEEKIEEKRGQMNHLQQFVDENSNLINLVKKLPEKLHHNVMVPFGKMAFFPGRLIHTNEFLVLLGENYYSDKTSKQTVDFLKRRDKTLQSQIHSLKAEIEDFQTEATFFATTASEAAEGLVEIREEYVEEEEEDNSSASVIQSSVKEPSGLLPGGEEAKEDEVEDDEFARIMSRLRELEREEEEEENDSSASVIQSSVKEPSSLLPGGEEAKEDEVGDDEFARIMSRLRELEMEEEHDGDKVGDDRGKEEHDSPIEIVEEIEDDMVKGIRGEITKQEATIAAPKKVSSRYSEPRVKSKFFEVLPEKHQHKDLNDPLKRIEPKAQYLHKEDQPRSGIPQQNVETWRDFQANSAGSRANAKTNVVAPQKIESPIQKPEPKFDSNKAFTGSIIEHAENLETNTSSQIQSSGSKPSKPVSRFKAQRR